MVPTGGAKLHSISLENFTKKALNFSPNLGVYCAICRISKNTYFVNGGIFNCYRGHTYLIDLENKDFTTLTSTSPNAYAACVYKDKLVYMFGGQNESSTHSGCKTYNIKAKVWKSIASLPQSMYRNTAADFNGKIYVCGYENSFILFFDGNSYHQALSVGADTHKFICSGWVVAANKLYEMKKDDFRQWPSTISIEFSSCSYKRKNFIYFIDSTEELYRINTDSKIIENVQYG